MKRTFQVQGTLDQLQNPILKENTPQPNTQKIMISVDKQSKL
jgi:hypothetical protein